MVKVSDPPETLKGLNEIVPTFRARDDRTAQDLLGLSHAVSVALELAPSSINVWLVAGPAPLQINHLTKARQSSIR
jgi:hypothetical protein